MEAAITSGIDREIEKYKSQHRGTKPLYCIMSADEADELADFLRKEKGDDDLIITSYRDIKIIRNSLMEPGKYFLSNELPETGS